MNLLHEERCRKQQLCFERCRKQLLRYERCRKHMLCYERYRKQLFCYEICRNQLLSFEIDKKQLLYFRICRENSCFKRRHKVLQQVKRRAEQSRLSDSAERRNNDVNPFISKLTLHYVTSTCQELCGRGGGRERGEGCEAKGAKLAYFPR